MANIKGRKGGGGNPRTPVESPDSLHSIATAKILLGLGEGEFADGITAKDIFLDGTPKESVDGTVNFPDVTWEFRSGTQMQDYIPGMPAVENEITINTALKATQPWTRAISNTQLSAVRVRIAVPALQQQFDNGDVAGYRVDYKIELSVDGGGYSTVLTSAFDGKTTSLYERSHRIDLPKASTGWQIRVSRSTPDSTSSRIADVTNIAAYSEIIDAKLRYPNTALLFVTFDAKQFNNIPQISVKARGRIIRVPSNYDPVSRTYSGTWDGSFKWAYSNNPAWVYYDVLLNERFGLGDRISSSQVDKWELYRIAQYCDQLVPDGRGGNGTEPRFLCDVYIQSQEEAFTVLRDLASIFRGMTYWSNNQVVAIADMPAANDERNYIYTRANVIDGKFIYSSGSERDRYSTAIVSFSDPDNHYSDEPEPVFEGDLVRRYGVRQTSITAIACTRRTEANRRGRWMLLTNAKDRLITFNTGLDGYIPQPGRIIYVADQGLSGRIMGGRVSSVNGRIITLDRIPDAVTGDRLLVNLPSGKSEARTIQAVNGKLVTVSTAWSVTPEPEAVWSVDAKDVAIQQYRVTSVKDNDDNTFTISGVYHNPDKYAAIDSGARLDERPISAIPPGVQGPPDEVSITSYSRVVQGLNVETMRVSWLAPGNAIAYECQWRKDNGDWVSMPRTSSLGFEVEGIYSGRYLARVSAINASDIGSVWKTSAEVGLTGKVGNPPKPVGFTASSNVVFGIELNWGFSANTGDTLKTEIQYSPTGKADDAILLADVPYPQRRYQQMGLKPGQVFFYRAQLVDKTGNQSGYTGWVRGESSIDVSDITDAILEEIKDSDLFKEILESALEESEKVTALADAIRKNAENLASAVESNKETTDQIIADAKNMADGIQKNADDIVSAVESGKETTDAIIRDAEKLAEDIQKNAEDIINAVNSGKEATDAIIRDAEKLADGIKKNSEDITQAVNSGKETTDQIIANADKMANDILQNGSDITAVSAANRQTAQAIINNSLALADVVVRQSVHYGENSAKYEQLREVIATETEARVTDVTHLEARTAANESGLTEVRQTLTDETEARTTAVDQLTAKTDKNTADVTSLTEVVATMDGATSTRFEELAAKTDHASGAIQNNAQAIINNSLAQVDISTRLSVQNGENSAKFEQVTQAIVTETEARVSDVERMEAKAGENAADINAVRQAITDESGARVDAVEKLTAATDKNSAGLTSLSQVVAEDKSAAATRMEAIETRTGNNETAITNVTTALTNETEARSQAVTQLNSKTDKTAADVTELTESVATLDGATSTRFNEIAAKTEQASGAIQNNAQAIISNSLAQASTSTRISVQNGENEAKFEQVTQAIVTETEARVTDTTRLEAATEGNKAEISAVRQAVSDESSARVDAVDKLTVATGENTAAITRVSQAITDETEARTSAVEKLTAETEKTNASVSGLAETVATLDGATSTRFDEITAKTDQASGAIQNNAQAIISNSLAQADISTRVSVQSGDNAAKFEQVTQVIATETEARVNDVARLEAQTGENTAVLSSVRQAITDETSARVNDVEKLTAETGKNAAGLTNLSQVVADEKTASATRMSAIETRTGNNESAIKNVGEALTSETEARVSEAESLRARTAQNEADVSTLTEAVTTLEGSTVTRFDEITAKTDQASGAIQNNAQAIISNSLAQADISTRLSVQNGDNAAKFEQVTQAIVTETEARVTDVTRIEVKTDQNTAGINSVRQAVTDETSARSEAVDKLTADTGKNAAGLTDLSQVVADEKVASATRMAAIETRTGNNEAAITNVNTALTTEEEARTRAVNQLNTRVGNNESDVSDLTQAVTTLDSAMASRLEELKAQTDNASGSSKNNAIALITNTLAQVNIRQTLSVQYNANQAEIDRIDTVIADEKSATATALEQIKTDVAGNAASVTNLNQTVSNYQQATATQISTITASVNGNTALISDTSKAVADINGELSASRVIKVAVDDNGRSVVSGIGLGVNNDSGVTQSEIIMNADQLFFTSQINGVLTSPFIIKDNQVIINDLLVGDGSITNAKIGNFIQSNDYVAEEFGWSINKNGGAEFNNVTVRGKVYATDGEFRGTVYATDGRFEGTVIADKIEGDVVLCGTWNKVELYGVNDSATRKFTGGLPYASTLVIPVLTMSSGSNLSSGSVRIEVNGSVIFTGSPGSASGSYSNSITVDVPAYGSVEFKFVITGAGGGIPFVSPGPITVLVFKKSENKFTS